MKMSKTIGGFRSFSGFALGLLLLAIWGTPAHAYTNYTGCSTCHGDFDGPTSPKGSIFPSNSKHDMHRSNSSMATACDLCHGGSSPKPVIIGKSNGTVKNKGVGCTGCHVASGLRAHHFAKGVTECYTCHAAESAPAENVKPPYYGTVDTKVKNPGNTSLMSQTNENWSVGDFLGLDNDGNNLYDLADFAIGPYRVLSANREGNDLRVTWQTAGGRTDAVQASAAVSDTYANVSSSVAIPGIGIVTTNFLHVGGATNRTIFYRLKHTGP